MTALETTDDGRCLFGLREVVGLPVRIGDVDIGRVRDVLLNRTLGHVLGLVVDGRGAHRHFLPWLAARVERDHVSALSIFALLSPSELVFYIDNGTPLNEQLGRHVDDVVVDAEGDVVTVVAPRARQARPTGVRRPS